MVDGRKQVTTLFSSVNHTYTRSTLCIEHCFTDFKFKPLNLCIYILPLFTRGKEHFFWGPKPGSNLHSEDTLALKK